MKNFKSQWKDLANAKKATAANVFQLCLLKAVNSKNYVTLEEKTVLATNILESAFTAITNNNKLTNGCTSWQAVVWAGRDSRYTENQVGLLSNLETQEEVDFYRAIWDVVVDKLDERTKKNYVYVIVRTDIAYIHQAVQAGHAALRAGAAFVKAGISMETIADLYFAYVGVANEEELKGTDEYLYSLGFDAVRFNEPNFKDQVTAIATFPIPNNKKKVMARYERLEMIDIEFINAIQNIKEVIE